MLKFSISPSLDMDIGNLRLALFNYILAQQKKDTFLVRIEDNNEDNLQGKDTEIMQILEKFALVHSSVFHQSEHLHMHQTLAIRLLEEKKAFICTCIDKNECLNSCYNANQEEYAKLKENSIPFVIRIKDNKENSFVILDQKGIPSYDFASACDDMLSGVDFIIYEERQKANIARQKHIKMLLGFTAPTEYKALSILLNNISIKWLLEEGFIPDAIINYLLLLGNSKVEKEIFTLPQALEFFTLDNISKSPSSFELNKLRFINKEHLKIMDDKKLSSLFGFADANIGKLAKVYLEERSTTKELQEKISTIFAPKDFEGKWKEKMKILASVIQDAPMIDDFSKFQELMMKSSGLKGENFFKPLNILLTGTEEEAKLSKIYPLIKAYLLEIAS